MLRFIALLCLAGLSVNLFSAPLDPAEVPEPLSPWVDWVVPADSTQPCPFVYSDIRQRQCSWPSGLQLQLDKKGGSFSQQWRVFRPDWIVLPGDARHWPQNVRINQRAAVVVSHDDKPSVHVEAGSYTLSGKFKWQQVPESLSIPSRTGIVRLKLDNRTVRFPEWDQRGQLWLRKQGKAGLAARQEKFEIQVFRQLVDDIPQRLITRIQLDISGKQREILLGNALYPGTLPLRLDSRLPAMLETDGQLRVQVRPGRWSIDLESRFIDDTTEFSLPSAVKPWPHQEIWVFQAMNEYRLVELAGETIDPRQTRLPQNWQTLPAYLMKPDSRLQLTVIRRGDPEPEPNQLHLSRNLWLDFDGAGYTVKDIITGSMTHGWRLDARPVLQLGRVEVDGQPRFITRLADSETSGVEIRRGQFELLAISRYTDSLRNLPASGWDTDFRQVSATLHLPPGWRLLGASGVDNVPGTWLNRWSLLDLFLVLVIAVAIARLWHWRLGLLALVALVLSWHEPFAPQWIWINLLLAIALLRAIPRGPFRLAVYWYRNLSILGLALILIVFSIDQVRTGLYPQLERPGQDSAFQPLPVGTLENKPLPSPKLAKRYKSKVDDINRAMNLDQVDPGAVIQTGPGLPDWQWTRIELSWNGPVSQTQQIRLQLISPAMNTALHFLRLVLLFALATLLIGVRYRKGVGLRFDPASGSALLALVFVTGLAVLPATDASAAPPASGFPPPALLKELKQRLTASPDCLPDCASISRMKVQLSKTRMTLRLEVHADATVALPLPSHYQQWLPEEILVDGTPAKSLYRDPRGGVWLGVKRGRYQILMRGRLPERDDLKLPLPLKPHHVSVTATGWTVDGLREDGQVDKQLQLTREQEQGASRDSSLSPGPLPPFFRVERTLRLGLDWYVETRVIRASPPGSPISIQVPLLRGESPITEGLYIAQNQVQVNMAAQQRQFGWRSVLAKQVNIRLNAPQTTEWVEIWRVDLSPIWHMTSSGLAVVHHQDKNRNWLPEWRPWPGETVSLDITRPEGVKGDTLTIDNSKLTLSPGQRGSESILTLSVRSSQGQQHAIHLPPGARLQSVSIDGRSQPIRQDDNVVILPVVPGKQHFTLSWRDDRGLTPLFKTRPVELGIHSTNASSNIQLGHDRWLLFVSGPDMGPAVLYWGVLIVLALVAFVLGKLPSTPLHGWQWFLLSIGLSQVTIYLSAFIVLWLIALGARGQLKKVPSHNLFNAMQLGLALFSLIALLLLFTAVEQGLLGQPEMHVSGYHSSAYDLNWYQDRVDNSLPRETIVSVPLYVYRALMLAWALWLAFSLIGWLRWGWACASVHGLWQSTGPKADGGETGRKHKKSLPASSTSIEMTYKGSDKGTRDE